MKVNNQQIMETSWQIIQSNTSPECLNSIEVERIKFTGKPKRMKAKVQLHNPKKDTIWVQELKFIKTRKLTSYGFPETLQLNACLAPGETKTQTVRVSLPDDTVKGSYDTKLKFGSKTVPVTFDVQDDFNLAIFPQEFITQGVVPEQDYEFEMEIINNGNMDYIIPKLNHSLILDTQYHCKARSWATMNDGKEGEQAFKDGYYKRVNANLAFWVKISLKETGQVVKAGDTIKVHLTLRLPKNVNRNSCYSGEIAIVGKQIIKYQLLA